jgi:hypothetical protein
MGLNMKFNAIDCTIMRLQMINECLRAQLKMRQTHRRQHSIGRPVVPTTTINMSVRPAAPFYFYFFK